MTVQPAPQHNAATPIENKSQLVETIEAGCKPAEAFRVGVEYERFSYQQDNFLPLSYNGGQGIRRVLENFAKLSGGKLIYEHGKPIAIDVENLGSITLEPGGQVELSGRPRETVFQTHDEACRYYGLLKELSGQLGVGFMGAGFHPKWQRDNFNWMPKDRYRIMRGYIPTRGFHGLDMMLRTCSIQANLDFSSETDMVQKFRLAVALQPIICTLFANSPFCEGQLTGYKSYRSFVWQDTDPDRTGWLPFVFDELMGFEHYVDYALDVPMFFIERDGLVDVSGLTFRDYLNRGISGRPDIIPTMKDWEDHLTTLFPVVRLKSYLEMRGADSGRCEMSSALAAMWVGLLYDEQNQAALNELVRTFSQEELGYLTANCPKHGLQTVFRQRLVVDWAGDLLAMAHGGLKRRAQKRAMAEDETQFLKPLDEICHSKESPADELVRLYQTRWNKNINPALVHLSCCNLPG